MDEERTITPSRGHHEETGGLAHTTAGWHTTWTGAVGGEVGQHDTTLPPNHVLHSLSWQWNGVQHVQRLVIRIQCCERSRGYSWTGMDFELICSQVRTQIYSLGPSEAIYNFCLILKMMPWKSWRKYKSLTVTLHCLKLHLYTYIQMKHMFHDSPSLNHKVEFCFY